MLIVTNNREYYSYSSSCPIRWRCIRCRVETQNHPRRLVWPCHCIQELCEAQSMQSHGCYCWFSC